MEATVKVFRIRNWKSLGYEVSQNARTSGPLPWVAMPTKHDGKGFRRLMRQTDGLALFGAWCLLVQVAAKCPLRGTLADADGMPLTPDDLSLKTDAPAEAMSRALTFLSSGEMGWLECVELDTSQPSATDRCELSHTERNGTGRLSEPSGSDRPNESREGFRQPEPTGRNSVFEKLTDSDLRNTETLLKWFNWQAESPKPVFDEPSDEEFLKVLQAAEYAIEVGKKPIAKFSAIVGKREFASISAAARERGKKRLREFKR